MRVEPMDYGTAIVVDDLRALPLEPGRPVIYDRDIGIRLLHIDPSTGAEHYLIRYPAGLGARAHRHTAAHTIIVLEGRMRVNGTGIGPGGYCHFPAGEVMRHAPEPGADCLFVTLFSGPFDVHPLD